MSRRTAAAAVTFVALAAVPAMAELSSETYECERGVRLAVTYLNVDGDPTASVAVIDAEGLQVALPIGRSASGARYSDPDDRPGYIWWAKGETAILYWRSAPGAETAIYSDCAISK